MLEILDTGIATAEENMRFDEKLLENLQSNGYPILHLYSWAKPSATYGYFIRPENHLDLKKVALHHLDLARRSTGGGIVFHIWDLAFSFLMPSEHPHFSLGTLQNYQFVNKAVLETVQTYFSLTPELIVQDAPSLSPDCKNFCMAKPTQYDVVYKGMKIAGAAQRKRKQGYLHQGTISLFAPKIDLLTDVLLSKKDVVQAMTSFTFAPIKEISGLRQTRIDLQKLLADKLNNAIKF
jgi:lipoate-protein ligase A